MGRIHERPRVGPTTRCNEAFTFNLVFTRVVNHCVTVLGIDGLARQDGGASHMNRLAPILKAEREV
jgi:hypothetical protein